MPTLENQISWQLCKSLSQTLQTHLWGWKCNVIEHFFSAPSR